MQIAEAFVAVKADTKQAKADAKQFASEVAAMPTKLQIDALPDRAKKVIADIHQEVTDMKAEFGLTADDQATPTVRALEERVAGLSNKDRAIVLHAEAKSAQAEIDAIDRKLRDPKLTDPEIRILIDQRHEAEAKIKAIEKDLGELPKTATRSAGEISRVLASAFGTAAVAAGIKKSIDLASNLNETLSKTQVLFGESGDAIVAWSTKSAKAFGLSQQAALDAASTFAVFGKGAGLAGDDLSQFSEKLVGLASDFASFYNTSPQQAIDAIGAALRGESEPIRQYGVLLDDATLKQRAMNMGLYDGKGILDQHSRVLAAQAEILAQTSDAQGDFARTADGLANSQRIASAESANAAASLGQNFLPVYKQIVKVVGAAADVFGSLPGPIQMGIVALAAFVALSGPLKSMISIARETSGALSKLITNSGGLSAGFAKIGGSALALGSVAAIAFTGIALHQKAVHDRNKQLDDDFKKLSAAADDQVLQQFFKTVADSVLTGRNAVDELVNSNIENARRILEVGDATGKYSQAMDVLRKAITDKEAAEAQAKKTTEEHSAAISDATAKTGDQTTATDQQTTANSALQGATTKLTDELNRQKTATDAARAATQQMRDDELSAIDAKHGFLAATLDNNIALKNYDDEVANGKLKGDDLTKASLGMADQMYQLSLKFADSQGAAKGSTDAINDQIWSLTQQRDSLAPNSPLRQFLQSYIDDLNNIPRHISTELQLQRLGAIFTASQSGNKTALNDAVHNAAGSYVPANSNITSTLSEPGAGPEAVLPLGNPNRLRQLLDDKRISDPIAATMGGGSRGGVAISVGDINGESWMRTLVERRLTDLAMELMAGTRP